MEIDSSRICYDRRDDILLLFLAGYTPKLNTTQLRIGRFRVSGLGLLDTWCHNAGPKLSGYGALINLLFQVWGWLRSEGPFALVKDMLRPCSPAAKDLAM